MTRYPTLQLRAACIIACLAILFGLSTGAFAQLRPNLGTASTYAIFTGGGAINVATGDTAVLTGDVGQDGSYAFNGFPPSTYTGTLNRNNAAAAQALTDLETAQTADGSVACGTVLGTTITNGQTFYPGVYCAGAATTTNAASIITFNAQGNGSAIFIVKINGAFSVASGTQIVLANNARAGNIYWFVNGQVTVADSSVFTGTIIADGEISFAGKSSLNGRALASPAGAINLGANHMSVSNDTGQAGTNNLTVVKPASGDSILRNTLNDTIRWTGTGITRTKTLQYSLDSGHTWTTIATITTDSFSYSWHVPDTTSTKAMVRVTDTNNLRGVSGIFTIKASAINTITVITPAAGAMITEGTLNDTIKWTGTGLNHIKTFAYSLDSGKTWTTIGKDTTNGFTYVWNVPDTVSSKAMISVTDSNGVTGNSGVFTILSNKAATITVIAPAAGALITEGTLNDTIKWTGTGLNHIKTFAYSLDSGKTWTTIGKDTTNGFTYLWNVPNAVSTKAMIRITDSNGVTGYSGLFTIHSNQITVTTPTPGEMIPEQTQNFQITWSGTGITPQKTLALSLDGGQTWTTIGVITANVFTYYWNVPDTTSNLAIVRVTDSNGMTGQSALFSITSNKAIVVVHPTFGQVIAEGLQNYQITWTGAGLAAQKTFELSLDGGQTWTTIGKDTTNGFTYNWNVPNTASTQAIIRITDANNVTGESGLFTIKANAGTIAITDPAMGEIIAGGTVNYLINWTATNVTTPLTLEYSLDGGLNWTLIGVTNTATESYAWALVPNVATTRALVRINDANGVTGISGLFTITTIPNVGTMNSLTLGGLDYKSNIGNNQTLEITWGFTGDIGTSVDVQYSLDYTTTWNEIATVPVTVSPNSTAWQTTSTGYYNPVFIRVTSSKGMTLTSIPFSIGSLASVASDAAMNGYSISNYPNPANSQTTIRFVLPTASDVTVTLFDALGRNAGTVTQAHFDAGSNTVPFNTSNLAPGMYSYMLQAGATKIVGTMDIIR